MMPGLTRRDFEHVDPGRKRQRRRRPNRGFGSPRRSKRLTSANVARWALCLFVIFLYLTWVWTIGTWGG